MAVYVVDVKLPYERAATRFAVYHSSTETLYSPSFDELDELIAYMFAREYSHRPVIRDSSERVQILLLGSLRAFLAECFPDYQRASASLPAAWRAELPQDDPDDDDPPVPDAFDLLWWYQQGDDRADVAQRAFRAWEQQLPAFTCTGCGREEGACSADPCADVIADREAV